MAAGLFIDDSKHDNKGTIDMPNRVSLSQENIGVTCGHVQLNNCNLLYTCCDCNSGIVYIENNCS